MGMHRRTFLLSTAASASQIVGANDRLRAAIIGSGGRGRFLTANFKELGVDMAAVCDVYEPNLEAGLSAAGNQARAYRNYKALLENKDVGVVIIDRGNNAAVFDHGNAIGHAFDLRKQM